MEERRMNRATGLFLLVFLGAGIANLLSVSGDPMADSLMTAANYLIYTGLLLFWLQSVRARLLPSRERSWTVGAAALMLSYQLLRVFKYRFAVEPVFQRYTVYLYFVPMTLIPTFFLMTCLRITGGRRKKRWNEAYLLIPSGLLFLAALTNDLHRLVYAPAVELALFAVDSGTYAHGPVFYVLYAWMILCLLAGLALLFRETGWRHGKAFLYLLIVVAVWFLLILMVTRVFDLAHLPHMYNNPEIHTFGMLGVFEVCIRHRLIPNNMNYPAFFSRLQIPALVTDRAFRPVYRSQGDLPADEEQLRASITSPVYLKPDLRLSGREIRGGCAFWAEDEKAVHQAQERLAEANELIESENTLIQAETEQKEKDAWLRSRHRIYHEIAEIMYPCQRRIGQLLSRMEPDTPAFRDQLAYVSVLNAYVKRKTNLLLLSAEQDSLTTRDLFLALRESANYLSLAGLRTDALQPDEEKLPSARVIALYDSFEAVAEQLIGRATSLMVSWKGSGLTLAAEAEQAPSVNGLPVPVRVREEEGILYMDLLVGKGGEPS